MIFDGGLVDAQIASATFEAEASRLDLKATVDERAYRLGEIWIELEKARKPSRANRFALRCP